MMASTVPTARAMIGVPRNVKNSASQPVIFAMETMEEMAISRIGTTSGAMAFRPPGSLPYSALSSS